MLDTRASLKMFPLRDLFRSMIYQRKINFRYLVKLDQWQKKIYLPCISYSTISSKSIKWNPKCLKKMSSTLCSQKRISSGHTSLKTKMQIVKSKRLISSRCIEPLKYAWPKISRDMVMTECIVPNYTTLVLQIIY